MKLLVVLPALEIVVEEISIEKCLNKARNPCYPMDKLGLGKVAIDPVENVECSVSTKKKDVLSSQIVNISSSL